MAKGAVNRLAFSRVAETSFATAQITPADMVSQAFQGDPPVADYTYEDDKDYVSGLMGNMEQAQVTQFVDGAVTYRLQPYMIGVLLGFAVGQNWTSVAGIAPNAASYTATMTAGSLTTDMPSTTLQLINARGNFQLPGCKIKSLEIIGEAGKLWTVKVEWRGSGVTAASTMVWTTVTNNRECLFGWNQAAIKIAGVDHSPKMRKFSLKIENKFQDTDYGADSLTATELEVVDRLISGTFEMKEDPTYTTVIDAITALTDETLEFVLTGPIIPSCSTAAYSIDITLPRCKFTQPKTSGGKGIQMHQVKFDGLINPGTSTDIGPISVVNAQAALQ